MKESKKKHPMADHRQNTKYTEAASREKAQVTY